MRRHHDQGNSYNVKHLIGAGLQFQRFSPLSSWWEAWRHAASHGDTGAEVLHLHLKEEGDCVPHWEYLEHIGAQSLLPKGYISSNKALPPNSAAPYCPMWGV